MNKLYYIVCEDKDRTLYEGRCQARTRHAALKHLKQQLGRSNLTGLVFTITEIPVPLIREIVQAVLENRPIEDVTIVEGKPVTQEAPEPPARFDAYQQSPKVVDDSEDEEDDDTPPPALMRKPKKREPDTHDWDAIKAFYLETGSPKQTAEHFDLKLTTLNGRIKRGGWAQERKAS